jgi:hypothetical protein
VALLVGGIVQLLMLAFGLHASLLFGRVTSGRVYWALNGVYMIVGFAVVPAAVRWHSVAVRLGVALALLLGSLLLGLSRATRHRHEHGSIAHIL